MADYIQAEHESLFKGWPNLGGENAHKRSLGRAVWPKKSENFSNFYEVRPIQDLHVF